MRESPAGKAELEKKKIARDNADGDVVFSTIVKITFLYLL
jgi:hypothetical protein